MRQPLRLSALKIKLVAMELVMDSDDQKQAIEQML